MLAVQHVDVAGDGDEDVALTRGVIHLHDPETVHRRLERFDRVDLGHDDVGAVTLRPRGEAAADPPVAGDHKRLAREQDVGRSDDPVDGRLPCAVPVVEHVLRISLVDRNDWIGQHAVLSHGAEADHTGGRLLGAADNLRQLLAPRLVQDRHEVRPVIHRELRPVIEGRLDVLVVGLVVLATDGIGLDAVMCRKRGRDRVVRG